MKAEQARTMAQYNRWMNERLSAAFEFSTIVDPGPKRCALWVAVAHFFNHQTHHRGQLTALLSRCGCDYGPTDLIWLPGALDSASGDASASE